MTADELARSYFLRARKRWLALQTLMQGEAYPDVVRKAQELVELVLNGMLRWVDDGFIPVLAPSLPTNQGGIPCRRMPCRRGIADRRH